MDKLLCISAFYKNDQPNGIGVSMSYEAGDLDQIMAIIKQHWDELWRVSVYHDDTAACVRDLLSQLDALGQIEKGKLTHEDMMLAMGNIYLLQKVGKMPTDEFNGLQLIYKRPKTKK